MLDIIYIGFVCGYIDEKSIVNWADSRILNNNFDETISELSVSNDVLHILKRNAIEKESIDFYLKVFEQLFTLGYSNLEVIQEEILKLYHNKFIEDNDDFFLTRLLDNYYLKKDGFSTNMDLPKELQKYLTKFERLEIKYYDLPIIVIDYIVINEILN